MRVIFANSGNKITYGDGVYEIVESGIHEDGTPYVELKPPNEELVGRMCEEIRKHGSLTIRIGGRFRLVLGDDEYPIRKW